MRTETPITKAGYDAVQEELNHLIKVEREEIKVAISEARELGDLKENAEYHSAKEKQAIIEGRISQLQGVIAAAKVIDPSTLNSDKVVFGAHVTLLDVEKDETVTYQIVGDIESDFSKGKVSFQSPLGKALIGKEEGDTVIVRAPKGDVEYEVDSVDFKAE
ncbi:MAG: transcription elongation factor GreA [Halobacteriovoraceae bacterium]|jgi:transcription elongation factor GreA|nr:transcription elongation factor GreA [Halobacteriovoraceae bacterium]MBC96195.1 transcription elongation factor GreA [Halobacteriovoraceae bacterium]|tara:strand:- start:131662 stop:132144 length:483 start_codon:yes stop_codon:yes gene_type:complete